jgi:hypothetical protein
VDFHAILATNDDAVGRGPQACEPDMRPRSSFRNASPLRAKVHHTLVLVHGETARISDGIAAEQGGTMSELTSFETSGRFLRNTIFRQ